MKKVLYKSLVIGLPFLVFVVTYKLVTPRYQNTEWLAFLFGFLSMAFVDEVVNALEGKRIAWDDLTSRDKKITVTCVTIFLTIFFYQFKEKVHGAVILVTIFIGYLLYYIIAREFGSEEMKKRLWRINQSKK